MGHHIESEVDSITDLWRILCQSGNEHHWLHSHGHPRYYRWAYIACERGVSLIKRKPAHTPKKETDIKGDGQRRWGREATFWTYCQVWQRFVVRMWQGGPSYEQNDAFEVTLHTTVCLSLKHHRQKLISKDEREHLPVLTEGKIEDSTRVIVLSTVECPLGAYLVLIVQSRFDNHCTTNCKTMS